MVPPYLQVRGALNEAHQSVTTSPTAGPTLAAVARQRVRRAPCMHAHTQIAHARARAQLAEANLGLGRFQQAEEFLSLANWSVLKNPDCSNAIRSQLHRNFGKLYSAKGRLDEALQELAKDIYCSSLEVGPEHVDTSAGYYHMASIFYTQVGLRVDTLGASTRQHD